MTKQVNQVSDCCPRCGAEAYQVGQETRYECGSWMMSWARHQSPECKDRQIAHLTSLLAERDAEVERLRKHMGHMIWLVEVQFKEDGGHIVSDAKELLGERA